MDTQLPPSDRVTEVSLGLQLNHVGDLLVDTLALSKDLVQGNLDFELGRIRAQLLDLAGLLRSQPPGDSVVGEARELSISLLNVLGNGTLGLVEPLGGTPPGRVGEILNILFLHGDVILEEHIVGLNILAAPLLCLGIEERLFP